MDAELIAIVLSASIGGCLALAIALWRAARTIERLSHQLNLVSADRDALNKILTDRSNARHTRPVQPV